MRRDRRCLIILRAVLGVLAIGLLSLLLAQGIVAMPGLIILGMHILGDLPQIFWWAAGVAALIICGLGALRNLGIMMGSRSKESTLASSAVGRFGVIYRNLSRRSYGEYSRKELRKLLGSLAIDLIALKRDIPESEAARIFREGDWTDDPALRSYFLPQESSCEQGRGLWRRLKKSRAAISPEETQEALARLISYGEFQERTFGISQAND
jgi:hypothetical protein